MGNISKAEFKSRRTGRLDARPMDLARRTGRMLLAVRYRLVTAESCTGGMIAEWITRVPGSSDWFERGLVTYSNEAKIQLLGVKPETLKQYGAVSEATACEMALGALDKTPGEISVAVTGIAGPDGGSRQKPVGTVCLAWAERDGPVHSARVQLHGDRPGIRRQSAALALIGLQDRLRERSG